MPNGGTVSFKCLHHCVVNDNNKLLISSFLPTLMVFFFANSIKGKSEGSGGRGEFKATQLASFSRREMSVSLRICQLPVTLSPWVQIIRSRYDMGRVRGEL